MQFSSLLAAVAAARPARVAVVMIGFPAIESDGFTVYVAAWDHRMTGTTAALDIRVPAAFIF